MAFETNTFTGTSHIPYPGSYPDFHTLSCANCGTPLLSGAAEDDLTCPYCGQHHRFLEPPEENATDEYQAGDRVAVEWGGKWWAAHVVEVVEAGEMWKIHFDGWAPAFDDVVDSTRIRAIDHVPGETMASATTATEPLVVTRRKPLLELLGILAMIIGIGMAAFLSLYHPVRYPVNAHQFEAAALGAVSGPVSEQLVTANTPLQAGQRFHVKWGNDWYMGTAVYVHPATGEVLIRYDGWGADFNEVVPRERLRLVK
jgi:predicted  nucleic acid-binding Zn-ribbon protein